MSPSRQTKSRSCGARPHYAPPLLLGPRSQPSPSARAVRTAEAQASASMSSSCALRSPLGQGGDDTASAPGTPP
ncbi:hypothetical protein ACFPRL_18035 [Pseudoclavibacter helvolus]